LRRGDSPTAGINPNLFDGYFPTGTTDNGYVDMGNGGFNYPNYLPGGPTGNVQNLNYSIHLGSRPIMISRIKRFPRNRAPVGSGLFAIRYEFWGALNPTNAPLENAETGVTRLDNLKYWTGWSIPEINGSDEWKKNGEWTLLGTFVIQTPSGARKATDTWTAEDHQYLLNGMDLDVDLDKTNIPVNVIRFKILEVSNVSAAANNDALTELQIFGAYAD
jgi:hypothetical protein